MLDRLARLVRGCDLPRRFMQAVTVAIGPTEAALRSFHALRVTAATALNRMTCARGRRCRNKNKNKNKRSRCCAISSSSCRGSSGELELVGAGMLQSGVAPVLLAKGPAGTALNEEGEVE